jgi:SAM-dependent methyltransferase
MLQDGGFLAGGVIIMDAHQLGFRAESFDATLITRVLHHLNIDKVAAEVHRVLRRGGRLVFYEPLSYGPVMWAIRQVWLRLHGMKEYDTTEHEEGLQEKELEAFHRLFAAVQLLGENESPPSALRALGRGAPVGRLSPAVGRARPPTVLHLHRGAVREVVWRSSETATGSGGSRMSRPLRFSSGALRWQDLD